MTGGGEEKGEGRGRKRTTPEVEVRVESDMIGSVDLLIPCQRSERCKGERMRRAEPS